MVNVVQNQKPTTENKNNNQSNAEEMRKTSIMIRKNHHKLPPKNTNKIPIIRAESMPSISRVKNEAINTKSAYFHYLQRFINLTRVILLRILFRKSILVALPVH